MTRRRLLVLASGPLLAAAVCTGAPALADGSTGTVTAHVAADSWYRPLPDTCTTPAGCAPTVGAPPASQYPADTLHVGVLAGQEEARTYLGLDLSALPYGATIQSGSLTVPIGPSGDGTLMPASAKVKACLSSLKVDDAADGVIGAPPKIDCSTSVAATMTAAVGSAPAALSVDLTSFASALSSGSPTAIVLLPADGAAQSDVWDLAFSAHTRKGSTLPPPSAQLTVSSQPLTDTPLTNTAAPAVATTTGNGTAFAAPPLQAPSAITGLTPPVTVSPSGPGPALASAAPVATGPALVPAGLVSASYAYPAVWLIPLLFLAALGWLGRALTRELSRVDN